MIYTPDILRSLGIDPTGLKFHGSTIPYDPTLRTYSREMRNFGTKGEAYLWMVLKDKQTGYKFTRQKPILHYIADFYCHELQLVVEVDGSTHNSGDAQNHDRRRDRDMQALGLKVVRLCDSDILKFPLASTQAIFQQAGVPLPEMLNHMFVGGELLWGNGYIGRL